MAVTGSFAALAFCAALLVAAVHAPPLQKVLGTRDLGPAAWGLTLAAAALPLVLGQLHLAWRSARGA